MAILGTPYALYELHKYAKKQWSFYRKHWRMIAAAAIAVFAPQFLAANALFTAPTAFAATIGNAFAAGALAGFVATGSFKGALIGGITAAAAFAGVGGYFDGLGKNSILTNGSKVILNKAGEVVRYGLSNIGHAVKTFAHGVVGGLSSKLSGGSFSKSFLSTAVVQAFAPRIDRLGGGMTNTSWNSVGLRTGAAALLGGISQKLIGGSFSMGHDWVRLVGFSMMSMAGRKL